MLLSFEFGPLAIGVRRRLVADGWLFDEGIKNLVVFFPPFFEDEDDDEELLNLLKRFS